jgi:hypothetical protein
MATDTGDRTRLHHPNILNLYGACLEAISVCQPPRLHSQSLIGSLAFSSNAILSFWEHVPLPGGASRDK